MPTTTRTLADDIRSEILVRAGYARQGMTIADVVEIFSDEASQAEIHTALLDLRAARVVRLVACGACHEWDMETAINLDGGEIYVKVAMRQPE